MWQRERLAVPLSQLAASAQSNGMTLSPVLGDWGTWWPETAVSEKIASNHGVLPRFIFASDPRCRIGLSCLSNSSKPGPLRGTQTKATAYWSNA